MYEHTNNITFFYAYRSVKNYITTVHYTESQITFIPFKFTDLLINGVGLKPLSSIVTDYIFIQFVIIVTKSIVNLTIQTSYQQCF